MPALPQAPANVFGLGTCFALAVCATMLCEVAEAKEVPDEVGIFFETCMATIPTYDGIGELFAAHEFMREDTDGPSLQWGRKGDGSYAVVTEADTRRICMIGRIGIHTKPFIEELEKLLWAKYGWLWERKHYQGRHLYLVRQSKENVVIEVIPPSGATTFIASYVLLEK